MSPDLSGKASGSESGEGYWSGGEKGKKRRGAAANGGGRHKGGGHVSRGGGGAGKIGEAEFVGPQWSVGDLKAAKKKLLDLGYGRCFGVRERGCVCVCQEGRERDEAARLGVWQVGGESE